jgi:hypothetical protein
MERRKTGNVGLDVLATLEASESLESVEAEPEGEAHQAMLQKKKKKTNTIT